MGILSQYDFGTSPELLFCPVHLRDNPNIYQVEKQPILPQQQPSVLDMNTVTKGVGGGDMKRSTFMIDTVENVQVYAYDPILRLAGTNYTARHVSYFDTATLASIDNSIYSSSNQLQPTVV